jgi:predicted HAD superfamily Cof-like phosphohydrolase
VETFDALLDLQYVLDGAFLALGFHRMKDDGLKEVHRSNMSKLGPDGLPVLREDGKVMKGDAFEPPDLASVLRDFDVY